MSNMETVSEISPKKLFPVYTQHPDLYKKVSKNMVLIDEGEQYKI